MKVHGPKNKNIWVLQNSDICYVEKKKVIKKKVQKSVYKHATSFIKGECIHLYVYIYIEQLLKAQETGNLTLG